MPGGRPRKPRSGPKKPLSAYTLFVVEVRNSVSKKFPELGFQEVAQRVGLMWRELPEEHRQKYQQLADQDKRRYDIEKDEWKIRSLVEPPEDDRQRRKKRKGAPKNPLSAYTYYIMDVRKDVAAANPSMSFREVAIAVGRMWHQLSEDDRKVYNQKAEQDKARYENEMINWTQMLNTEAQEAAQENKSKKRKKTGPKNPLSAYTYFVIEQRPIISTQYPKLSFGEVATRVGQMWRALDSTGREKYDILAREDKERYDREKEMIKNRLSYMANANALAAGNNNDDDEEDDDDEDVAHRRHSRSRTNGHHDDGLIMRHHHHLQQQSAHLHPSHHHESAAQPPSDPSYWRMTG
ncbi:High mobility group protein [Hondaea fermentalgiana]|uniref:High mobility group protein n=1 Tax=Hondaea fermentalgiana TaxID=2315210 RepID=A0A2R5GV30_9STRA|nr:High mobility group protein [Hondaea fermentalgiana]|eukprot:GBG34179.1 High mobility group protein [Hondaea fermentalgiana]